MTLEQLRSKAARKLNEVLRALVLNAEPCFPLYIPIAKPKTTAPLSELLETVHLIRSQSREQLGYGYTIEWERVNSRKYGHNDFPKKLSFQTAKDFLRYVGASEQAAQILSNTSRILEHYPDARTWCASHLNQLRKAPTIIDHALQVADYFKANPAPNCYARQLPIAVPTKFIESERALLDSFFNDQLPHCFVSSEGGFEERIGLLTKESLIEFRSLDPSIQALPFQHSMATANEMARKAALFDAFETVVVVENHVPFLTLPKLSNTLAIMGNGFAIHRLAQINWLREKRLYYWGDMDLAGFAILAKFRESHSHAQSVMMDAATFHTFQASVIPHAADQSISEAALARLTDAERAVVSELKALTGKRLEQEHITDSYVQSQFAQRPATTAL